MNRDGESGGVQLHQFMCFILDQYSGLGGGAVSQSLAQSRR